MPDSKLLIALMRGKEPLYSKVRNHARGDFGLSSIVLFELFFGAVGSRRREENLARLDLLQLEPIPFDPEDAMRAAEIRVALKSIGAPIGPYDVLIAGQALARNLTLLTRNVREFRRVEGLSLENWEDS